jgi:isohexenylglutaconyl-CoA hydratase
MTTLPQTKCLVLEQQGSVLTIWFNRPEAKNALSAEMVEEMEAVLDAVREDRSLRTLILRGKGGMFCAGGDIKGFKSGLQSGAPDEEKIARGNRSFGNLMVKLN